MVDVDLRGAKLSDCRIFGISVWKVKTDDQTEQNNLVVSDQSDPVLTVDNLKVAQFIYLLLNNEEIRGVIDTITSKVVLILGRFTPERKVLLDALREELRRRDYLPVMFDFTKPGSRAIRRPSRPWRDGTLHHRGFDGCDGGEVGVARSSPTFRRSLSNRSSWRPRPST